MLLEVFPFIAQSKKNFEHQYKLLNKVTLTGKINSNSNANNLFDFTTKTGENFSELKDELIELLLEENLKTVVNVLRSKASVTIDILIRNLFERTADVGFLATDSVIVDFLTTQNISRQDIIQRLNEYVLKYSVYNEIVIFDTEGNVKANLNPDNQIDASYDKIIEETLLSNEYIERYAHTDIFEKQEKTLTFTQKIEFQGKAIGVLCLCFKFDDEMQRIFKGFEDSDEVILLTEKDSIISSSKNDKYPLNSRLKVKNSSYEISKKLLLVAVKASAYQGYSGLDWKSVAIKRHGTNFVETKEFSHSFIDENVQNIIEKADNIVEDLADIIINGELIAAKTRMYLLNPILDNLRTISTNLLKTFKDSADNLEQLVQQSLKFNLLSSSKLAIDIMDRNLYERANDSRWWALTPLFIEELQSVNPDVEKLNGVLLYINELYTVYTNIFIYDSKGKIVANSNDKSIIGDIIYGTEIDETLKNSDSQKYFVSEFVPSNFYDKKPTYIYHASIVNDASKCIGGVGVVFDSTVEFKAILDDSFTHKVKGISLFITDKGKIISSTDSSMEVLSEIPLSKKILNLVSTQENFYDIVTMQEEKYILASAISKGYREYKVNDNYTNKVIALTLVKI